MLINLSLSSIRLNNWGNTVADGANGILRKTTIAVSLKNLSNFWRSFEMPLIN